MLKKVFYVASVAAVALSLNGCAGKTYKATSDFGARMQTVKKVGIVVPSVVVKTAGFGTPVVDQERTAKGQKSMEAAILKAFKEKGFEGKLLSSANSGLTEMEQQLLSTEHNVVVVSNRLASKDDAPFKEVKVNDANFEGIKPAFQRNDVDAIAVFTGVDHNLSGGKIAAHLLTNIITVPFGVVISMNGLAHEQLSLMTNDGKIVYVDEKTKESKYFHMEDEDDAEDFADEAVTSLTEATQAKI